MGFLSRLAREALSSPQTGSLLRGVVSFLRDLLRCDAVAAWLVEEEEVVLRAAIGGGLEELIEGAERPPRVKVGTGLVGLAAQSQTVRHAGDVTYDPAVRGGLLAAGARSELAVPLVLREETIAVLDLQSSAASAFDEADARLVEVVGALVAPAVHAACLYEREVDHVRDLRLAAEISKIATASLDEENVVAEACRSILEALDAGFVGIALYEESPGRIRHAGHASLHPLCDPAGLRSELGRGVVGRVIETGETLRVDDASEFEGFVHVAEGMGSALCVPLRTRERIIGALEVEHAERGHFTDEDADLLQRIATHVAQAVENATLFEIQRRRWQQLLVIHEATRIATEPLDLDDILAMLAREVHDRFGHFAVGIFTVEDHEVVARALRSEEGLEIAVGHRERLGVGVAGRVATTGEVFTSGDAATCEEGPTLRSDSRSLLGVPLRTHRGVSGVILVESLEPNAFDSEDCVVLETLAKAVAGAIANARLLRQTEQLREDLNRMIVHDLRNPVQAVLLTLQEVRGAAEGKLAAATCDSVSEGVQIAEELLEMVNSLLDVSRFEAGKAQIRLAPGVLNDHIRAIVRRLAPVARAKRIQVTTVLSPDVPVLRFDHELLGRAIANLVGNALKFTPDGAGITIRSELARGQADAPGASGAEEVCDSVVVAVADTGEGIPVEYQDKIFEKFGQVESRKAGLQMSTGLGLALCRYVIEAHGGKIWVESSPGHGSTFSFTLPTR
jgi:two-component system, NtrC family, sensor histidine kinase KinB